MLSEMRTRNDVEKHVSLLPGIPSVADFMARNTDKSAIIFRRFDKLASSNLLVLHSRLTELEEEQDRLDEGDYSRPTDEARTFALGWTDIEYAESKRAQLRKDIQTTVKEYHEALLLYSQVLRLGSPATRSVQGMQDWLNAGHGGQFTLVNRSISERGKTENVVSLADLISLHSPAEDDPASRIAAKYLGFLFVDSSHSNQNTKYLNERRIQRFVTLQGTTIAIALLVAAMWALWRLGDNMVTKLAAVTGFIVAFAIWVSFFTSAQRKEVFAATAAYAAVLVVYLGKA